MNKFIYNLAQSLYSKGATINGSEAVAKALNSAGASKKYAGGRGSFRAVAGAYKHAHDAGKPDAWKILDAFRGKDGDHLWKK